MSKNIINVGLDVHKESIDVGLAPEGSNEIRHYGTIGGDLASLDRARAYRFSSGHLLRKMFLSYHPNPSQSPSTRRTYAPQTTTLFNRRCLPHHYERKQPPVSFSKERRF